jgi:cullin 1
MKELLQKPQKILLEKEGSGLRSLLDNNKMDDVSRMYRLFVPIGLDTMVDIFKDYIIAPQRGREPMEIHDLIEMHERYLSIISTVLDNNLIFQKALTESFRSIIHQDSQKYAERLSSFCDQILRKRGDSRTMTDHDVEDVLEKVVKLFTYLADKDLFLDVYKNHLAQRLLTQKSYSEDWEKLMMSKLKLRCGSQYTSRMEGMLYDVQRQHYTERFESIQVLTAGYWPTCTNYPNLCVPTELKNVVDDFTQYYRNQHSGRKLTWCYGLGTVFLRFVTRGSKVYHLTVSTLQAILLLFMSGEMNLLEMQDRVHIPLDHLKPLMRSLSCSKYKILVKIEGGDRFTVNTDFSSPKKAITLPVPILEESRLVNKVEEDRSHTIDATIVRIMKTRKVMSHSHLVGEVMNQLPLFQPDTRLIKQRIHQLVDREFLERDPENSQQYKYLA